MCYNDFYKPNQIRWSLCHCSAACSSFPFLFVEIHSEIYLIPSLKKSPLISSTVQHQSLCAAVTAIRLKRHVQAELLPAGTQQLRFFWKNCFPEGLNSISVCCGDLKKILNITNQTWAEVCLLWMALAETHPSLILYLTFHSHLSFPLSHSLSPQIPPTLIKPLIALLWRLVTRGAAALTPCSNESNGI